MRKLALLLASASSLALMACDTERDVAVNDQDNVVVVNDNEARDTVNEQNPDEKPR